MAVGKPICRWTRIRRWRRNPDWFGCFANWNGRPTWPGTCSAELWRDATAGSFGRVFRLPLVEIVPLQSRDAIDGHTEGWPREMTAFRDAVDRFLAEQKSAAGTLQWRPSRDGTGVSAFWLISTRTGITDHRLHVVAYPLKPFPAFTVMVEFRWQGREFPVIRLNIDSKFHIHLNYPPRPIGVETRVHGNRFYPWRLNRRTFNPLVMFGLPYCVPERPQGMSLPSAIRKVAAESAIDIVGVDLPEFPPRLTLI